MNLLSLQPTPLALPQLAAVLVSAAFAVRVWMQRVETPGSRELILTQVFTVIWSLMGALDTVWKLQREPGSDLVRIECGKQKDGQDIDPFYLRAVTVDVTQPVDLDAVGTEGRVTSLALERVTVEEGTEEANERRWAGLTQSQRLTIVALVGLGPRGATAREWRGAAEKAHEAEDRTLSRQAFDRQLEALVEKNVVRIVTERDGVGVYLAAHVSI